ncbi:hypothetical protein [Streptomyces sp. NBC_01465]|uniref:hypothetical protein n=1 Tax=Streptomyces sp. NBC_01465 TaxID=2903878 RepID=UPI002E35B0A3|nr:hypothetical protein [Streptomyces sp. NBC_01465]
MNGLGTAVGGTGTRQDQDRGWGFFAAWAVVGGGCALAVLTLLSIGIFVLPVAALVALLLTRFSGWQRGLPGLVSGLGVPLLYVAYLNRGGPGTVCTTSGTGQTCTDEWNPWLWLVGALIPLVVGVVAMVVVRRQERRGVRSGA